MQGATSRVQAISGATGVSIHAPYAGSDNHYEITVRLQWMFQSTPPMQGATGDITLEKCDTREFQSTPPMQGATEKEDVKWQM